MEKKTQPDWLNKRKTSVYMRLKKRDDVNTHVYTYIHSKPANAYDRIGGEEILRKK